MKIAVHQPNLIPWKPFFEKVAAVDTFVVLTQCQFNRRHYQHRFQYANQWYSLSVRDIQHFDTIYRKRYLNPKSDWESIKRRLPQFAAWFDQFDACLHEELWRCNLAIILKIAQLLNIKTPIILDPLTALTGTERIIEICQSLNAKTYLSGRSGADYLEMDKFARAGITVEFQTVNDTRHIFEL